MQLYAFSTASEVLLLSIHYRDEDSNDNKNKELELGILQTYSILWKILQLKPVIWMAIVLLTGKV